MLKFLKGLNSLTAESFLFWFIIQRALVYEIFDLSNCLTRS